MDALLLMLLDSRAPAGGHVHSGGMEAAVDAGLVRDLADLEAFCQARLLTSARVTAAFAGAAWSLGRAATGRPAPGSSWDELDAEYEARLPSEALRAASRSQGSGLRRLVSAMLPAAMLPPGRAPHHPLVLGAAVAAAGGDASLAARAAALAAITGPASAAVRLLGLDPLAVQAMLARLAPLVDDCAGRAPADVAGLPCGSLPYLDLLAEVQVRSEVRLFAS